MNFPVHKFSGLLLLWGCCSVTLAAAQETSAIPEAAPGKSPPILIDRIVAVVNDDVITGVELEDRLAEVRKQLKSQSVPLPAAHSRCPSNAAHSASEPCSSRHAHNRRVVYCRRCSSWQRQRTIRPKFKCPQHCKWRRRRRRRRRGRKRSKTGQWARITIYQFWTDSQCGNGVTVDSKPARWR